MIITENEYQEKYGMYDRRWGGPFDRGAADSYYGRAYRPHYFLGDTHSTPEVQAADMTPEDIEAYRAGFDYNERLNNHKEW